MSILGKIKVLFGIFSLYWVAFPLGRDFIIQTGDVLNIYLKNEEAFYKVTVSPTGEITLPLIGSVAVANLSLSQVKKKLVELYSDYLTSPELTVVLEDSRGLNVFLFGKVSKPGVYPYHPELTLLELLFKAGLQEGTNLKKVKIIRKTPSGSEIKIVNFQKFLESGDYTAVPKLEVDDVIYIPARRVQLWEVWKKTIGLLADILTIINFLVIMGIITK
jgi:polysaccharide export outer membrane protein